MNSPFLSEEQMNIINDIAPVSFSVGSTYFCRSVCDHECIFKFTVISRTAKRVTLREVDSDRYVMTVGAKVMGNEEHCYPYGKSSMAPVLRASRKF